MTDRMSGRALAAALGVNEKAVRNAVVSGRILKGDDGKFDLEICREAWGKATDPARSKVRRSADTADLRSPQSAVRTERDAEAAVALIARVLKGEGVTAGVVDFGTARTAELILRAYERDLKIAQRRKELVPLAEQTKHVDKMFIAFRQAWQRMPSRHVPEMAARLGCDPALLDELMSKAIAADLEELSAPVVRA